MEGICFAHLRALGGFIRGFVSPKSAAGRAYLLLAALLFAAVLTAAPKEEAPKLLSTTGGQVSPKWKDDKELQRLAEKGDAAACLELGVRCERGTRGLQDYVQARTWYERAAKGGSAEANHRLAVLYRDGLGVVPDLGKTSDFYQRAAFAGLPIAQRNLGAMLASGRGVKRDYVEGLAWLIVANRNGIDPKAEQQLRAKLARRPADIAAAEIRAEELRAEIDGRKSRKPAVKSPQPQTAAPRTVPVIEPPHPARPKVEKPDLPAPAVNDR